MPETQRLANEMKNKPDTFRHLGAPQLMKHALGLATHHGSGFRLLYVYFDAEGPEGAAHKKEIANFSEWLNEELGFRAYSYQNLIAALHGRSGVPATYLEYLHARYVN